MIFSTRGRIRNFSVIAHIDHGKSTLADRILEITRAVSKRQMRAQFLDSMALERERGITIKLKAVRLTYSLAETEYQLNLIDTPGHVDFGYEVSRSLAACEGALLVVDATQGIQAQTLSNYDKAKAQGLKIIPVINKIDLPAADPDRVALDLMESFHIKEDEIVRVSAKTGSGVDELLKRIVRDIPAPAGRSVKPLRVLVFASLYSVHKGVVAYVRVVDGVLKKEQVKFFATGAQITPIEIGIFHPTIIPVTELRAGGVGCIATGLKEVLLVRVGDTITTAVSHGVMTPLPGYKEPQPMV